MDEQTHVVGSDSVNVEAKTLALTGAVVANASIERDAYGKVDKMTDQDNLTIEVADVTVADVSNRDEHESSHVGVDVSGFSGAVQVPQGGSMGIRVSTGGHRKAGVTAATLGEGVIVSRTGDGGNVGQIKNGVNRDLSSRQVTHVDETTGGLDVNIRVDNQLLTDTTDYVVEGAKNTVGLVGNTAQAIANGSRVAANLGAAVVDNVTGNGHDGVVADFQGRLRNQELGLQSKINDELVLALNQLSEARRRPRRHWLRWRIKRFMPMGLKVMWRLRFITPRMAQWVAIKTEKYLLIWRMWADGNVVNGDGG